MLIYVPPVLFTNRDLSFRWSDYLRWFTSRIFVFALRDVLHWLTV
jgi:hypothetical protein